MSTIDVPVALLGHGTVGSAVSRLLVENAEDIERATGHRLRLVRALVRDPAKERSFLPDPGILTTDFADVARDPDVALVADVMGGIEPAGSYVLELLRSGKPVVSANKQLIARRGAELFGAASRAGVTSLVATIKLASTLAIRSRTPANSRAASIGGSLSPLSSKVSAMI